MAKAAKVFLIRIWFTYYVAVDRTGGILMACESSSAYNEMGSANSCPTFRYGEICKIIDGLNSKKARSIGALIEAKWTSIIDNFVQNPHIHGFKQIIPREKSIMFEQFAEGPIFVLPEFKATISEGDQDFSSIVRPSITVCFKPHHSKVWVRVLYDQINSLDVDALALFFDAAEKICKKMAFILRKEIYQVSLELIGLKANVEAIHKVCIKVVLVLGSSESDVLKIPDNAKDVKEFDAGRIRGSASGSCFKYKIHDITNITCILSGIKGKYDLASYTNEFSKTLVELIALRI